MNGFWRDPRPYVGTGLMAVVAAGLVSGPTGALGMALGLVGMSFGILSWWWVIRLVGRSAESSAPKLGSILVVFGFLVHLPLIVAFWIAARAIGDDALGAFLIGIGLVYCGLIGWFVAQSR